MSLGGVQAVVGAVGGARRPGQFQQQLQEPGVVVGDGSQVVWG